MKYTGVVIWFDKKDGNGIIRTEDKREWYTDTSVSPVLERGQTVSFEENKKIKDCRCAMNVKVAL